MTATMVALVNGIAVPVLLVRVTVCAPAAVPTAVEVKVRDVGATVKGVTTLPARATDCGLVESPSVRVKVAVSVVAEGVKITVTVQVAPEAMEAPQVVV